MFIRASSMWFNSRTFNGNTEKGKFSFFWTRTLQEKPGDADSHLITPGGKWTENVTDAFLVITFRPVEPASLEPKSTQTHTGSRTNSLLRSSQFEFLSFATQEF